MSDAAFTPGSIYVTNADNPDKPSTRYVRLARTPGGIEVRGTTELRGNHPSVVLSKGVIRVEDIPDVVAALSAVAVEAITGPLTAATATPAAPLVPKSDALPPLVVKSATLTDPRLVGQPVGAEFDLGGQDIRVTDSTTGAYVLV